MEAVLNPASGGTGDAAAEDLKAGLEAFGLDCRVSVLQPGQIDEALQAAIAAEPDLVVVLAGDGTASRAAELCGPDGPLLAPLPGGTMNLLPRALYGDRTWPDALALALSQGVARSISGGEVGGRPFHCAAILGSPALWGPAREAARAGDLRRAWQQAKFAYRRAFSMRLRFQIDGAPRRRAMALSLICPLVSRALTQEHALEAAALDLKGATEVFRLGLNDMLGDWRRDPAVTVQLCLRGRAWAGESIPCLVDGEMHHLGRSAEIRFRPRSFRALAPPASDGRETVEAGAAPCSSASPT